MEKGHENISFFCVFQKTVVVKLLYQKANFIIDCSYMFQPSELFLKASLNSIGHNKIPHVRFRKTVSRVSLGHCLQHDNNGFVTRGNPTVMGNRSAQVQTPAGLTDTESKCRYQMSDQLTLKSWF